ncbi:recombination mediator RecR [Aliikangiella sp. IMCC44359]|uniref:recombination mediator RecR n=1 Tax=Aliikangiella sp. IMCC44359 TaxID=3459125 RepID=UPI00403AD1DE
MESKPLLQQFIAALQCLPGVGQKSAQRMAYHLLNNDRHNALKLAELIERTMQNIDHCERCRDYTEATLCELCRNEQRDNSLICVVESPADIAAIEATASYSGKYFVLMGCLSPLDGIGPEEIGLNLLKELVIEQGCEELIIATSSTVEGETTAHFIVSMLDNSTKNIKVSRLAQGVPIGGELEYLDSSTLALSLANRQNIKQS